MNKIPYTFALQCIALLNPKRKIFQQKLGIRFFFKADFFQPPEFSQIIIPFIHGSLHMLLLKMVPFTLNGRSGFQRFLIPTEHSLPLSERSQQGLPQQRIVYPRRKLFHNMKPMRGSPFRNIIITLIVDNRFILIINLIHINTDTFKRIERKHFTLIFHREKNVIDHFR